ncbi:MAG: NusG domain II-containing protein [Candidatus Poribacteria bacterium]
MKNVIIKDDNSFYKITKLDLILIILVLIFATFSAIWISADQFSQTLRSKSAVIYQENIKLKEADLSKDGIISILDGKMHIEVNKGKIRVLDSDCPNHNCMKMGWIKSKGQTIVCVPNRVLIEIKSGEPQSLDAISR